MRLIGGKKHRRPSIDAVMIRLRWVGLLRAYTIPKPFPRDSSLLLAYCNYSLLQDLCKADGLASSAASGTFVCEMIMQNTTEGRR